MDCRKHLFWSLAVLGGMTGCTTTGTTQPTPSTPITNPAQLAGINPADIKKESDLPMRNPAPHTCVEYGRFMAAQAQEMHDQPVAANQMRDTARRAYQQALKLDPTCLDASLGLADLYRQMEDQEHAIATLAAAAKQHPNDAHVWFNLGMAYGSRKEWESAIQYFTRARELEPENRTCVDTLGYTLARAGKPEEAIKVFKSVGSEAKAYYNVARMMQHMNQPDLSRQYLTIALQKDPRLQEAQQFLAQLDAGNASGVQQTNYAPIQVGAVESMPNP